LRPHADELRSTVLHPLAAAAQHRLAEAAAGSNHGVNGHEHEEAEPVLAAH